MNIFTGKKFLKFDKYPHYSGGGNFYIKTLLNLGFTKLTLRIKVDGYTKDTLEKANKCFAIVSPILRGNFYVKDNDEFEEYSEENKISGGMTYLYCYNNSGKLIGSLQDLKFMLEYDCVCDEDYPGVAYSRKYEGYIGFSHRAIQTFKIGDKLFDPKWRPEIKDITDDMIKRFEKTNDGLNNSEYSLQDKAVECISFKNRGFKIIETLEESKLAAKNFSSYVS